MALGDQIAEALHVPEGVYAVTSALPAHELHDGLAGEIVSVQPGLDRDQAAMTLAGLIDHAKIVSKSGDKGATAELARYAGVLLATLGDHRLAVSRVEEY